MPTIRPTHPSDHPALDYIFRKTAGPSFHHEPNATIGSYLFCHQYHTLEPQTSFVLDNGAGEAVGYILATADTVDFARRWKEATRSWDEKSHPDLLRRPAGSEAPGMKVSKADGGDDVSANLLEMLLNKPEEILNLRTLPQLAQGWPAHFHIDILPEFQRQGWGRRMIETMLEALRGRGAKGVHLGMEAGNQSAEKFYLAMGFRRLAEVLDGGESGEVGRTGGENDVVFMVKDLK